MSSVRLALLSCLLISVAACDLYVSEPDGGVLPEDETAEPGEPARAEEVLTVDALYVFAVGEPDASNPLLVAEADVQRDSVALNVWGETTTVRPCPEGATCRTRWLDYPLVSQTSLRLDVEITVDGEPVAAGANLLPLLNLFERAALITPHAQPTSVFAVVLEPERFVIPAGDVTATMRWGMESGAVFEDAATFEYVPAE